MSTNISRLDILFRRLLISKFFIKGWGNPIHIKQLLAIKEKIVSRSQCFNLVDKYHPIVITKKESNAEFNVAKGQFRSPLADYLGDILPPNVAEAHFQIITPKAWNKSTKYQPMCIHLAGTGDHYFWRRRHLMVHPLIVQGIGAIILENPFYGYRKPKEQFRSCLLNVSDIIVMGACLILEVIALLHFCEREGFGPLGVTGLSMGGHTATLAATNWPKPVVLVPCLSGTTASTVFTEGVLSNSINWDLLQKQFESNGLYYELLSQECKIIEDTSNEKDKERFKGGTNKKIVADERKTRNQEAVWFMRALMDEFTHVRNFTAPIAPALVTAIVATDDAYVPRLGGETLAEVWPGVTVRYVKAGHVGAYVRNMQLFQTSIVEAFERAKEMY